MNTVLIRNLKKIPNFFEQKQVYMKRKHVLNNLVNYLKKMLLGVGYWVLGVGCGSKLKILLQLNQHYRH